jgi:hypothetical protein
MRHILLITLVLTVFLSGFAQEYTITEKKGNYGLKTEDNFTLKEKYTGIYPCVYASGHLILDEDSRFWLLDLQTKEIFEIMELPDMGVYDDSCFYKPDDGFRLVKDGKIGYYQFPNTELIEPKYDFIYPIETADTLFLLQKGKTEFALHTINSGTISPWFTLKEPGFIFNFDDNLSYPDTDYPFPAKINDRWHIIKWNGEAFPCVNTELSGFNSYLSEYEILAFPIEKNGKVGFIDIWANLTIDFMYEDAYPFSDYYAPVKLNGKWGLIDTENNILIPFVYEKVTVKDYRIFVSGQGGTVETDEFGTPINFGMPQYHSRKEKFGFPVYGKKRGGIPYQFDGAKEFSEGLAPVNKGGKYNSDNEDFTGGKWGYILPTGKLIIDYRYDEAGLFDNGLAKVKKNGREFYIDRYGKEIMPEGE